MGEPDDMILIYLKLSQLFPGKYSRMKIGLKIPIIGRAMYPSHVSIGPKPLCW
jgi:hypothetical protein